MIVVDVEQGTDEWHRARLGIPTASMFDKIITPAKLELSKQANGYRNKLIGEWLRGEPDETFTSEWTERGKELEAEARDYYAFNYDVEPQMVGLCKADDERCGCSPDALLNDDGGLEIKCPSPGVHVGYLLSGKIPTEYRMQMLGSLLVTGRDYWTFLSYHPDIDHLPPLILTLYRKDVEQDIQKLSGALDKFCADLEASKQKLTKQLEQAA